MNLPAGTLEVSIQKKRIKNLYLRVYKNNLATLSIPLITTYSYAHEFLDKKKDWLNKQMIKLSGLVGPLNSPDFIKKDDRVQLMGRCYKLVELQDAQNFVKIQGETIEIHSKDINDCALKDRIFRRWWREIAYLTYDSLVDKWMIILDEYKLDKPKISIRSMKSLWGSCNKKKGKVTFNEYLLKADPKSIDYVILHELAHLKYFSHNKDFYNFVLKHMPDYKQRKKNLSINLLSHQ